MKIAWDVFRECAYPEGLIYTWISGIHSSKCPWLVKRPHYNPSLPFTALGVCPASRVPSGPTGKDFILLRAVNYWNMWLREIILFPSWVIKKLVIMVTSFLIGFSNFRVYFHKSILFFYSLLNPVRFRMVTLSWQTPLAAWWDWRLAFWMWTSKIFLVIYIKSI